MTDVARMVAELTQALGEPVATPADRFGHRYRVWRWDCPGCRAGQSDPLGIYRPFWFDSEGEFGCGACGAAPWALIAAIVKARAR